MSASALTPRPLPATPIDDEDELTDEELEAMGDEAMAEPGKSVDGPTFAREFMAETRRMAAEASRPR